MIDLPTDLPADIVPLSWLLGVWEGTGVIDYEADGAAFQGEFAHRVSFSHDGGDYVNYAASAWLLGDGESRTPLVAETGYWRLARPAAAVDAGPALLPAGVALDVVAFQIGLLAGPALGGVIVGAWGVGWCLAIDALTYLGSLYGVLGLPAMRPEPSDEAPGWRRALAGAKHVMKMPVLRGAFATDLAATLLVMPVSLFPAINDLRFGGRPETLGLFMSAIAVGGVVASLLSGRSSRSRRPGRVMLAAAATWAVGLLGFGLAEVLWLALFSLAVAGAADTLSVTSRGTIVQLQTPDSLRGRVTALDHLVGATGPDVGNMRGGFVASLTSVPFALVSGPIACLAVLGIVAWRNPAVRRYTPRGGG